MIGNSPRSDINPAMQAGLNAVYIPHVNTWQLEHETVVSGSGKLVIRAGISRVAESFLTVDADNREARFDTSQTSFGMTEYLLDFARGG